MIQSSEELDKFMEDDYLSDIEADRWRLDYAIRNNDTDLLNKIAEEEGC
jgi:hypothetical protein